MRNRTKCKTCNRELTLDHKKLNGYKKDGSIKYYPDCITCINEKQKISRKNRLTGLQYCYILPMEHYAGTTQCFKTRCTRHASRGKNIEGAYIFSSHDNIFDARIDELKLHKQGFKGFKL